MTTPDSNLKRRRPVPASGLINHYCPHCREEVIVAALRGPKNHEARCDGNLLATFQTNGGRRKANMEPIPEPPSVTQPFTPELGQPAPEPEVPFYSHFSLSTFKKSLALILVCTQENQISSLFDDFDQHAFSISLVDVSVDADASLLCGGSDDEDEVELESQIAPQPQSMSEPHSEASEQHPLACTKQPGSTFDDAIDATLLHKSPYATPFDALMAFLSVKTRKYGSQLDDIYAFFRATDYPFPIGSARSESQLSSMEDRAVCDELRFVVLCFEQPEAFGEDMRRKIGPVKFILRRSVVHSVVEMFTRSLVWPHVHWHSEPQYGNEGRVYSTFYSGQAYQSQQHAIGIGKRLGGVVLFSDSTQVLHLSQRNLHPIYMAPAGLELQHMGPACMCLVGFILDIPTKVKDTLSSSEQRKLPEWKRSALACVYKHIIGQIHQHMNSGIRFRHVDNTLQEIYPFVLTAVTDHLEGNDLAMLDPLACRYCLTHKTEFANTNSEGRRRRCGDIWKLREAHTADTIVEHDIDSFWSLIWTPDVFPFDPFMTCHCIFHDVEEGIWDWILTGLILPNISNYKDQELVASFTANLTSVPGLQQWSTLTESTTKFLSAKQMRHLLVEVLVILAGWSFLNDARDSLFSLLLLLCRWYELVRVRQSTEQQLSQMDDLCKKFRDALRVTSVLWTSKYTTNAAKHHIILHYPALIRCYGSMMYQSCEKWDSAHKQFIKAPLSTHSSSHFTKTVEKRVS